MTWQPIKTAPRDGTPVLIWSPDASAHGISLAQFIEFEGDPDDGGWQDFWSDTSVIIDAEPTHWMPLPEPPE